MKTSKNILANEGGATIIYVALIIVLLMMFTALAVDIGHLYGVRNELQDAADAGALAGASVLFDPDDDCELRAAEAIAEATRVTQLNKTGTVSVVAKSVQVGHWSFHTPSPDGHVFTANLDDPPVQIDWKEQSATDLDANPGYINAVRVVTERANTPSFFAKFFGFDSFLVGTQAVGYRGFSGRFQPGDFDQPIAICEQSITNGDDLECNVGRMINSGNDPSSSNTGGWTNFTQENSDLGTTCDTATKPTVEPYVCGTGNTTELTSGEGIGTTGGEVQTIFDQMLDCWRSQTDNGIKNWPITLPVVDCPANNVSNCATLLGAVSLNVIWMIDNISQGINKYDDAPSTMTIYDESGTTVLQSWSSTLTDGFARWQSFVDTFNLKNADGRPTGPEDLAGYEDLYQHKAIFFLPNCDYSKAIGGNGGQNFGVCSRSPVLVK